MHSKLDDEGKKLENSLRFYLPGVSYAEFIFR